MDDEKMEYLGNDEVVQEIAMKAAETADSFIFEIVLPFCQENYQGELKKEDLRRALSLLKAQEPKKVKCVRRLTKVMKGVCPACGMEIESVIHGRLTKFCKFCSQAVKWE